jgi:hypothetical protein
MSAAGHCGIAQYVRPHGARSSSASGRPQQEQLLQSAESYAENTGAQPRYPEAQKKERASATPELRHLTDARAALWISRCGNNDV